METKVIKIKGPEIDIEQIKSVAAAIDGGALAAFATETVYGIACRVCSDSLDKLSRLKSRTPDKHYTLHISDKTVVDRYVPVIGLKARKLIDRYWPGPLTIVFEFDDQSLRQMQAVLPHEVFINLYKDNSIGVRCPDDPVASSLLANMEFAAVAPSANITGHAPAVDAEGVLKYFSGQLDMILDGGPCRYGSSSTVVKVSGADLSILREGIYSRQQLQQTAQVNILVVCTGNTCRSPMAEGLFKMVLAEKACCGLDLLAEKGYKVLSCGTMGIAGIPVSSESVQACGKRGIDISGHVSRPLTQELVANSDLIFTMSSQHRGAVISLCPDAENKCMLLSDDDIPDPIGRPQQVYDDCCITIENAALKRVKELII